jgi:hypothetical protein
VEPALDHTWNTSAAKPWHIRQVGMSNVCRGTGIAETIAVAHCSANVPYATTRNNLAANPNFGRQALYSYGTSDH